MATANAIQQGFAVPGRTGTTPRPQPRDRRHLRTVPTEPTVEAVQPAQTAATESRAVRVRAARQAARASLSTARPVTWLRTAARVVYRDAEGSWIVQDRTLTMKQVFNAEYAVPGDYRPFQLYCRIYTRTIGVMAAAVHDGSKYLFIHPVRGPLAAAAIIAGTYIVPNVI